jgi:hypothetical protein
VLIVIPEAKHTPLCHSLGNARRRPLTSRFGASSSLLRTSLRRKWSSKRSPIPSPAAQLSETQPQFLRGGSSVGEVSVGRGRGGFDGKEGSTREGHEAERGAGLRSGCINQGGY